MTPSKMMVEQHINNIGPFPINIDAYIPNFDPSYLDITMGIASDKVIYGWLAKNPGKRMKISDFADATFYKLKPHLDKYRGLIAYFLDFDD
jgi:hypothetical protein